MPFSRPAPALGHQRFTAFWRTEPYKGEQENGDALFIEVGRVDGSLLLLLVDVTGHGAAAALTVDFLQSKVLPAPAGADRELGDLLTYLNQALRQEFATTGRFVAALCLKVDGTTGTVVGANAAQPEPLLGQAGAAWQSWSLPGGTFLGVELPNHGYQQATAPLASRQQLLAFTDGVSEAGAKAVASQFQHGPLQTFFGRLSAGLSCQDIVDRLMQALQQHVGAAWPDDDTTVMCLQLD